MEETKLEKKLNLPILIVSILIPVVVAVLFSVKLKDLGFDVAPMPYLPPIYATINGLTAILLVCAVTAVKKGNRKLHERLMTTAMICSVLFLVMYVAYHMTTERTNYGGEGLLKYVYLFILTTHILLSIAIIPMVLISYVRGLAGDFERHKKISKITYPLWLYVAVTGVVVYLMISPYYAH